MKEIDDFEKKVWGLIETAIKKKDSSRLGQLNSIAQDIERIKRDIERIEYNLDSIDNAVHPGPEKLDYWEITEGAIKHSYLPVTKAKKGGLIPIDGREFEVKTSVGQTFRTVALFPVNRLRARGEIKEFYEKAGIKPGDKVVWREVSPYKYHLSKM